MFSIIAIYYYIIRHGFTKKLYISIYFYALSLIHNTSLTTAYLGLNNSECVEYLFYFKQSAGTCNLYLYYNGVIILLLLYSGFSIQCVYLNISAIQMATNDHTIHLVISLFIIFSENGTVIYLVFNIVIYLVCNIWHLSFLFLPRMS
jgi:hypothetical protein